MEFEGEITHRRFSNEGEGHMEYTCYTLDSALPKHFTVEFTMHRVNDNPSYHDGVALGLSDREHDSTEWSPEQYKHSVSYISNGKCYNFERDEKFYGELFSSGDVITLEYSEDGRLVFYKNGCPQPAVVCQVPPRLYLFMYINAGSDVEITGFRTLSRK